MRARATGVVLILSVIWGALCFSLHVRPHICGKLGKPGTDHGFYVKAADRVDSHRAALSSVGRIFRAMYGGRSSLRSVAGNEDCPERTRRWSHPEAQRERKPGTDQEETGDKRKPGTDHGFRKSRDRETAGNRDPSLNQGYLNCPRVVRPEGRHRPKNARCRYFTYVVIGDRPRFSPEVPCPGSKRRQRIA